ncbi:hypothetical protein HF995_13325 [Sanguibacter hominis ATCC BAA-789]|uniref:Uncharacterized protein n=1 Tax=Sanguibacter hominis ATCC BAA-789 TaxID=1312740 RepID=A0A9X5FFS7_9MICO|nr:hypothetical protein [Sanguibacter hominis]NKX94237.1 hypothetical protein [Sanguibacter hominis ATCC BAA-789]
MDLLDLLTLADSPATIAATGEHVEASTRCVTCGTTAYGPCGAINAKTVRLDDGRWRTTSHCNCRALTWCETY